MKNTAYTRILKSGLAGAFFTFILLLPCCCSRGGNRDFIMNETDRAMKRAPTFMMEKEASEDMMMEEVKGKAQTGKPLPAPEAEERKRIYNGSAGLIVDQPEKTREKLEALARDSGGYVEESTERYVVLRVPSALFQELFQRVLNLGTVEYQETSSLDVTEAFADISRRLASARETRNRLYRLLEETEDARERAEILKEIGRLTEEIEALKQQLQMMENRLAFSRITVNLKSRLEEAGRPEIPFAWMARLDPLSPVSGELKARVSFDPGPDFAVFSRDEIYLAEDAKGCSISISSLENRPRGDSAFWQKALLFHKKDYYSIAEKVDIPMGEKTFRGVRFVSKDRKPYLYIAGLLAEKKALHVLEIFSPDAGRDLSPLFQALKEGEIR